jgi:peptidyl-prolyl cis-trans isomerase SurA
MRQEAAFWQQHQPCEQHDPAPLGAKPARGAGAGGWGAQADPRLYRLHPLRPGDQGRLGAIRSAGLRGHETLVLKRISVTLAVLTVACFGLGCGRPPAPGPNVWAVVNGHPILRQQVERYYRSQFSQPNRPSPEEAQLLKLNILDELINNELLLEQAQKLRLTASDSEVEQRFAELKAPYTDAEFQHQLAQRGISVDDLKNDLREHVSIQKLVNREIISKIAISEKEIEGAFHRNQAEFNVAEPQFHIAQILVTPHADSPVRNRKGDDATNLAEARRKIRMLLQQLKAGADFSELAMDYSEDSMSASTGGDLGFIPESALNSGDPAIKRAVLALKPGQISGILQTREGYRILKLLGRLSPGQRSISDPQVQQSIRETLRDRKQQLLRAAYLASLRDQAHITNYLARQILASSGNLPADQAAPAAAAPASPASQPAAPSPKPPESKQP